MGISHWDVINIAKKRGVLTAHSHVFADRTVVDGKDSPIFEEGPSRRKIFCLMEQSMILRRENIALIVAERNLLSSVGRNLALALLSSRTLGISRHAFGQTTSPLPASLFPWICAFLKAMG